MLIVNKKVYVQKDLTPAPRAIREGHKNVLNNKNDIQTILKNENELGVVDKHSLDTPEEYVTRITVDDRMALGEFINKIIALGSCKGIVSFMHLFFYMDKKGLLGTEIKELTGQEVADCVNGDKAYRLKPKNKQAFLVAIHKLSGLKFTIKNKTRTEEIRKDPTRKWRSAYDDFTLLKSTGFQTERDDKTIACLENVSIMKEFTNLWHKLSMLYIPLEDILKVPSDCNGDHWQAFNLAVAFRHAELGVFNDTLEWDLRYCLNAGQWSIEERRKDQAWEKVIAALEEGKKQELIDYTLIYTPNKSRDPRFIQKVAIRRLWRAATNAENFFLINKPEEILPRKKSKPKSILLRLKPAF